MFYSCSAVLCRFNEYVQEFLLLSSCYVQLCSIYGFLVKRILLLKAYISLICASVFSDFDCSHLIAFFWQLWISPTKK
jgi:hypothetical protein